MPTLVGTGASSAPDTQKAIRDAIEQARGALRGKIPSFGFVFAGPSRDLTLALQAARAESRCDSLLASSTAGEVTQPGLTHGGVAVMLGSCQWGTCRSTLSTGLSEH